jgi:hypothetical protein
VGRVSEGGKRTATSLEIITKIKVFGKVLFANKQTNKQTVRVLPR